MILRGFNTPQAEYYLDKISELADDKSGALDLLVKRTRELAKEGDTLYYSLPGLSFCWKCTVKHLGQALGFASELEAYPERVVCLVGELGHAYRECPDPDTAKEIRNYYTRILDTGCVPDFTPILKRVYSGWWNHLQDSK